MSRLPDPDALLTGPLGRWLAEQETVRATAKRTMWRRTAIGAVIGVIVGVAVYIQFDGTFFAWIAAAAITFIGFTAGQIAAGEVAGKIKERINEGVAEALGFGFSADGEPGPAFDTARRYGLFPSHDRRVCEDFWSGAFSGRPFELHEAILTETTEDSDGDDRTTTKFHGLVADLTLAAEHRGMTLVEYDKRHRGLFGGEKNVLPVGGDSLARVDIADPAFETAYTVWSTAPEAAKTLVGGEFGARLRALEQAFGGTKTRLVVEGARMVLVSESGTLFESGSLDADKDRAAIARIVGQFETLAAFAG